MIAWTADMSTNDVLRKLGITHAPTGRGETHEYRRDGVVVFTGSLQQVNTWLISSGQAFAVDSVAREIAAYTADVYKTKRNARAARRGGIR